MSGTNEKPESQQICGIVMPISSIDGCTEPHWAEVLDIITEAIEDAGFDGNLVSNADDVGIIQKRIIQNLYENPIVVCDVSGKNPNVMFELGMRLAFDKPTIIIKDDRTTYSFDTSPIEHLEYPRDLRFSKIVDFKQKLSEKIKATYEKACNDSSYTTFLKHFGEFKVAKIEKKEVPGQELILDELRSLRMTIRRMDRNSYLRENQDLFGRQKLMEVSLGDPPDVQNVIKQIASRPGVVNVEILSRQGQKILRAILTDEVDPVEFEQFVAQVSSPAPTLGLRRRRPLKDIDAG